MSNPFRPLVDRRLSELHWDEQHSLQVLRALDAKGGTIMKKKLSLSFALVAAIVLMASIALAAVTLIYSPAASASMLARKALIEQYGLTHTTLGLFMESISINASRLFIASSSSVSFMLPEMPASRNI